MRNFGEVAYSPAKIRIGHLSNTNLNHCPLANTVPRVHVYLTLSIPTLLSQNISTVMRSFCCWLKSHKQLTV